MKKINASIEFTNGKQIKLELYPEVAPASVDNFIKLASSGFYNGLCFHRVIQGFMIQGGGFSSDGTKLKSVESPFGTIKGEFASNGVKNDLSHSAGVISMARTSVKDSATSQFFICVADVPFLDKEYAAFGKTADKESLDVAVAISKVKTGSWQMHEDIPVTPIVIKSITIG